MNVQSAKNNALKAIQNSIENTDNDSEVDKISSASNAYTTPVTSQNAPEGLTLDLSKQYKRKIEFCSRQLMRIHNKALNKKDQGSEDGGIIYIDFQAGMFEALKCNFVEYVAKDYGIVPIAQPKIEYYGQAEERFCLDLQMKVKEHVHDVKMIVHNTKCSLNVQGFHDTYN